MKKSLITSGLLALAMLSASSAFAEANCQAHPKKRTNPASRFSKSTRKTWLYYRADLSSHNDVMAYPPFAANTG